MSARSQFVVSIAIFSDSATLEICPVFDVIVHLFCQLESTRVNHSASQSYKLCFMEKTIYW